MKNTIIVSALLSTLMVGCAQIETDAKENPSPYYMSVERVEYSMDRYENEEAICYIKRGFREGAISCFPKK